VVVVVVALGVDGAVAVAADCAVLVIPPDGTGCGSAATTTEATKLERSATIAADLNQASNCFTSRGPVLNSVPMTVRSESTLKKIHTQY